jgi:LPXTG-motif cell wall-anchored protein
MPATQGSPQLLYHFLRIGVSLLAAIFLVLRFAGLAPLLPATGSTDLIAYVMSGIAVVLVLIGVFVLKPAVPARRGHTTAEYWATPKTVQKAMSVWFIVEGAATISAIGFLMTGHAVAAAAMVLSIAVFWIVAPETFEKAG